MSAESCIEVHLLDSRGREVHLTVDGQVGGLLTPDDRVMVCRAAHPLELLVPPRRNHFEVMREKLGWGTR